MAAAGVAPRIMGVGPIDAARKLVRLTGIGLDTIDVFKLNEANAQTIASLRTLGIAPDDPRVNPNGGAIALARPLGMSGARLAMTAVEELTRSRGRHAMAFLCIGVGQGLAILLERLSDVGARSSAIPATYGAQIQPRIRRSRLRRAGHDLKNHTSKV
jgi:acetyl-CoA C-acetyltransferase